MEFTAATKRDKRYSEKKESNCISWKDNLFIFFFHYNSIVTSDAATK